MLLAVDTSTTQLGLALYDGAQVIAEYAWRSGQRHTVELAPATAELLSRCNLKMNDVNVLAVALGPGSFTSLRVGLAFVKGLALARNIPVIGIPTLDILAQAQPLSTNPLAVAIQAGRGRYALGLFKASENRWQAQGQARVVTLEALMSEAQSPLEMCGEFTDEIRQQLMSNENIHLTSPVSSIRRPAMLAELAWTRWQNNDVDEAAALAPIYLHTADPIT